jgi:quinone-modifying oxidoreductase subunit QmoA
MASLKQARYLREQSEEASATIFYIDIRAVGRHESFYRELLEDPKVAFVKGKVAAVNDEAGNLKLDVEDTIAGEKVQDSYDMVVLATGIVPNTADSPIPFELTYDAYGFVDGSTDVEGVYAAGCASKPCDVSRTTKQSTAAAMKAVRHLDRGE